MQAKGWSVCAVLGVLLALMGYVGRDLLTELPPQLKSNDFQTVAPEPRSTESVLRMGLDAVVPVGDDPGIAAATQREAEPPEAPGGAEQAPAESSASKRTEAFPGEAVARDGNPRDAWIRFLREHGMPPEDRQARWIELKNEAWNLLRNDPSGRALFEEVALGVLRDPKQPEVFRNYALQHLGAWILDGNGSPNALRHVGQAAGEVDSSLGGTALIALARISREQGGVPEQEIARVTQTIIRTARASEVSLIAALQLRGESGLEGVREEILALARDAARSTPVRMAAVAALGAGAESAASRELVRQLRAGSDERLRAVAEGVLSRWGH